MKLTADDFAIFTDYLTYPAPPSLLCVFWRIDWEETGEKPWVGYARDFSPMMNVAGLRWKLTGIAREELARMSEAMRLQLLPITGHFMVTGFKPFGLEVADNLIGQVNFWKSILG